MRQSLVIVLILFTALGLAVGVSKSADDVIRIVTLGDSITKGVRKGVKPDETFASLLQASLKKKGMNVEVKNVGIGGERTDQALKRLDDVIALKPRVVTVMYGTNDSYVDAGKNRSRITADEYRQNLEKIAKRLKAAGIQPIFMTEPRWGKAARDNGAGEHPNQRLEQYMVACRKAARQLKIPLVDHFEIWTTKESEGADIGRWTTDQCHPNPQGHRRLSEALVPVVEKSLEPDSTSETQDQK